MNTQQKIQVMQAYVDWKEIQYRNNNTKGQWTDYIPQRDLMGFRMEPRWDWTAGTEYRVKPENETTKHVAPTSEQIHEAYRNIARLEEYIGDLFERLEPDVYATPEFDYEISADDYDNSLTVRFKTFELCYPYEPCLEIRDELLKLGFSIIYWTFPDGDEVRGFEPRHYQHGRFEVIIKWKPTVYGYVDGRFNEQEWKSKYYRKG